MLLINRRYLANALIAPQSHNSEKLQYKQTKLSNQRSLYDENLPVEGNSLQLPYSFLCCCQLWCVYVAIITRVIWSLNYNRDLQPWVTLGLSLTDLSQPLVIIAQPPSLTLWSETATLASSHDTIYACLCPHDCCNKCAYLDRSHALNFDYSF